MVHEPTFMAYELRLFWHTNPDFYAIRTVFIGGGGGLQYIEDIEDQHNGSGQSQGNPKVTDLQVLQHIKKNTNKMFSGLS